MNALKIIRDTWSKAHQFFFFHKETSVTKYQKNVATAVDVEASEWVEEITINDEALMSNKKHINVEDVPETARPENIKKVRRSAYTIICIHCFPYEYTHRLGPQKVFPNCKTLITQRRMTRNQLTQKMKKRSITLRRRQASARSYLQLQKGRDTQSEKDCLSSIHLNGILDHSDDEVLKKIKRPLNKDQITWLENSLQKKSSTY
ncbi:unnamed protein product [Rhizophagus irregularis]|nr:unnamed protein product [Rhizophagus irregularis]